MPKIVMIGAGGFARRHLEVLESIDGVAVVGHQARRRQAAEAQARRFGGQAFDAIDDLLDACRPDAAWIVLPPGAHGPAEDACLARGIPFFVEKPLAASREPAERIAAEVDRAGRVTAVGYHWRALDVMADLRGALADREVRLVRGAWHDATPTPPWWTRRAESGGQIVEQATHVLDLARVLMGEAEVTCALAPQVDRADWPGSDVPPASAALLRYHAGPIGVFSATCALAGTADVQLELYAEGRRIVVDQRQLVIDDGRTSRRIEVRADPVEAEDRAFLEAVRTGDPSRVIASYADALASHRLALAIQGDTDERTRS